jgi:hypothetical protein
MPQGKASSKKASGPIGLPKHERYAKRVAEEEQRKGGPVKAAKSEEARSQVNQNFIAALPTMTRNAEMISAGKLIAQGSNLRTGELKKLAAEQLEMMAKKSAKVSS